MKIKIDNFLIGLTTILFALFLTFGLYSNNLSNSDLVAGFGVVIALYTYFLSKQIHGADIRAVIDDINCRLTMPDTKDAVILRNLDIIFYNKGDTMSVITFKELSLVNIGANQPKKLWLSDHGFLSKYRAEDWVNPIAIGAQSHVYINFPTFMFKLENITEIKNLSNNQVIQIQISFNWVKQEKTESSTISFPVKLKLKTKGEK